MLALATYHPRVCLLVALLLARNFTTSFKIHPPLYVFGRLRPGVVSACRTSKATGAAATSMRRTSARTTTTTTTTASMLKLPDEDDIDAFLDAPLYDPDQVLDDERSSDTAKRFARFVKNDYETAEALLAGLFFAVLVVIGQELLRHHIHGDQYVPFSSSGGSSGGGLF